MPDTDDETETTADANFSGRNPFEMTLAESRNRIQGIVPDGSTEPSGACGSCGGAVYAQFQEDETGGVQDVSYACGQCYKRYRNLAEAVEK